MFAKLSDYAGHLAGILGGVAVFATVVSGNLIVREDTPSPQATFMLLPKDNYVDLIRYAATKAIDRHASGMWAFTLDDLCKDSFSGLTARMNAVLQKYSDAKADRSTVLLASEKLSSGSRNITDGDALNVLSADTSAGDGRANLTTDLEAACKDRMEPTKTQFLLTNSKMLFSDLEKSGVSPGYVAVSR